MIETNLCSTVDMMLGILQAGFFPEAWAVFLAAATSGAAVRLAEE